MSADGGVRYPNDSDVQLMSSTMDPQPYSMGRLFVGKTEPSLTDIRVKQESCYDAEDTDTTLSQQIYSSGNTCVAVKTEQAVAVDDVEIEPADREIKAEPVDREIIPVPLNREKKPDGYLGWHCTGLNCLCQTSEFDDSCSDSDSSDSSDSVDICGIDVRQPNNAANSESPDYDKRYKEKLCTGMEKQKQSARQDRFCQISVEGHEIQCGVSENRSVDECNTRRSSRFMQDEEKAKLLREQRRTAKLTQVEEKVTPRREQRRNQHGRFIRMEDEEKDNLLRQQSKKKKCARLEQDEEKVEQLREQRKNKCARLEQDEEKVKELREQRKNQCARPKQDTEKVKRRRRRRKGTFGRVESEEKKVERLRQERKNKYERFKQDPENVKRLNEQRRNYYARLVKDGEKRKLLNQQKRERYARLKEDAEEEKQANRKRRAQLSEEEKKTIRDTEQDDCNKTHWYAKLKQDAEKAKQMQNDSGCSTSTDLAQLTQAAEKLKQIRQKNAAATRKRRAQYSAEKKQRIKERERDLKMKRKQRAMSVHDGERGLQSGINKNDKDKPEQSEEAKATQKLLRDEKTRSDGAIFICCSCHRKRFRNQVLNFTRDKLIKDVSDDVLDKIVDCYEKTSGLEAKYICMTCRLSLRSGLMPNMCPANPFLQGFIPEARLTIQRAYSESGDGVEAQAGTKKRPRLERIYSCEHCELTFSTAKSLAAHMFVHTGQMPQCRSNACRVCGFDCYDKKALRAHTQDQHRELCNFLCELCGSAFFNAGNLNFHMVTHQKEKNIRCDVCSATFTNKSSLSVHRRFHTNENPYRYVCSVCNKSFRYLCSMDAHMRYHTNARPYECRDCLLTFQFYQQLKQHVKKQHGIINGTS